MVTINSPIKSLQNYFVAGGGSAFDYCRAVWLRSDSGMCNSIAYYDSSQEGYWVGNNKHWLSFISGEAAPLSEQFNIGGIDTWPRNIDDSIVPISAQYANGADVIYYGEYGHNDFAVSEKAASFMAEQILRYIFGGQIECSTFARSGTLEHQADWLLGTDYWDDIAGEVIASSDRLQHKNESYIKWQEWTDTVGEYSPEGKRSRYQIIQGGSLPFLSSIKEARWSNPDDTEDSRLYIHTRAAPRNSIQVDWSIYQQGLLPAGTKRDHYEVEITTGTPLTDIRHVSWLTDNSRDLRIRIGSQAESPFRWYKAEWRTYSKESRRRKLIEEIPGEPLL
ncbi:hypothetical protein ACFLTZ_03375 [Chloroflexota bacterium]